MIDDAQGDWPAWLVVIVALGLTLVFSIAASLAVECLAQLDLTG